MSLLHCTRLLQRDVVVSALLELDACTAQSALLTLHFVNSIVLERCRYEAAGKTAKRPDFTKDEQINAA
jgi:hypothetical protein